MVELKLVFSSYQELEEFISSRQTTITGDVSAPSFPAPSKKPLRKNKKWTQYEEQYLMSNYHKFSAPEIAKALQRPAGAVSNMAYNLIKQGLLKKKNTRSGKVITTQL